MASNAGDLAWPPNKELWEPVRKVEFRDSDAVVASFNKTGTTWVQFILHCLKTKCDVSFEEIDMACPNLHGIFIHNKHAVKAEDVAGYPDPRVFKGHPRIAYDLPPTITLKRIWLLRNPLDTAVSCFNYWTKVGGHNQWMEAFKDDPDASNFVQNHFATPSSEKPSKTDDWFQFLLSWWPHRKDPRTRIVIYEKLHSDRPTIVAGLAEFMGIPADSELVQSVVDASEFKNMKSQESKFDSHMFQDGRTPCSKVAVGKVGKGQELSLAAREAVQQYWDRVVKPVTGCASYEELVEQLWKELWAGREEPAQKKVRSDGPPMPSCGSPCAT